ncbi:hypothetical protein ACE6H2_024171 [Prunus campanulata]
MPCSTMMKIVIVIVIASPLYSTSADIEFSELVFGSDDTFSFVHLGGGKVCFVVACSITSLEGDDDHPNLVEEDMDLIVVSFEFSISDKDCNYTRFLSAKTLGSCIFPFDFASESGSMFEAKLLGCFVR